MIVQHELEAEISRLRCALEHIAYFAGMGEAPRMRSIALNAVPQGACERVQGSPPAPVCPLLDAKIVEACANEMCPLDDLSTDEARDELRRDTRRGLAAAVAALERDELIEQAAVAIAWADSPDPGGHGPLDIYRPMARAALAAIGLLPAEERQ